jgi:hypothetical protein
MAGENVENTPLSVISKNGRRMTTATAWWTDHTESSKLYCIHAVRLDRECNFCEEGRE